MTIFQREIAVEFLFICYTVFWCEFFLCLKCDVYLRSHCFQTPRIFSASSGSFEYSINGQTAPEIMDAIATCVIFASGLYLDVQV